MNKRTDRRIRVLFFYPNEFFGPEMTVFSQIIRHLDRTRFVPYLVVNSDAEGDLMLSEEDGVIIRRWKFGSALRGGFKKSLRSSAHLPFSILSLSRFARREGIDIIQCTSTPRTATLGWLIARLARSLLLLHYHVIVGRYGGPRHFLEMRIGRIADFGIAVSRFLAGQLRESGIPAAKLGVVINGVDCQRFHPSVDGSSIRREYDIAPDEPVVLELARIIQQKRQEDLVQALAIARHKVSNLRGLLVGWDDPRYDGPFASYREELESLRVSGNLGTSLIIAQPRPEAPQMLSAANIVVLPSLDDACPLTVLEAMASGKPLIGANSGAIPELIADGVTGFLVPPKTHEALAERITQLALDPSLRESMGRAARLRAETYFDENQVASNFARVYEALANRQQAVLRSLSVQA